MTRPLGAELLTKASTEWRYKRYKNKGNWKCDKSPTGAHEFPMLDEFARGKCRWCDECHERLHGK